VTWIWRGIGVRWYTSRITGGLKEGRKRARFIGPLKRRIFPIFPNFTVGTMCVVKYTGTMLFRKGVITLWKYARQCPNPRHTSVIHYWMVLD